MTLDMFFSRLFKRQFHYYVKLRYFPNPADDRTYAARNMTVSMECRRQGIGHFRNLRKQIVDDLITSLPRHMKRNGRLEIVEITYLGWYPIYG